MDAEALNDPPLDPEGTYATSVDAAFANVTDIGAIQGKFRFNAKRVMLTYKTWLDKQLVRDFINTKCTTALIIVAHETGHRETPYDHTHVVIEFLAPLDTSNCRFFDWPVPHNHSPDAGCDGCAIHPNIRKIEDARHWEFAKAYTGKEDRDNREYYDAFGRKLSGKRKNGRPEPIVVDHAAIMACNTILEAYKLYPLENQAIMVASVFGQKKPPRIVMEHDPPREWQQRLHDELVIRRDRHQRHLIWAVDVVGGAGKSAFCEWFEDIRPEGTVFYLPGAANAADLGLMLKTHTNTYPNVLETILIDLPRQAHGLDGLYGTLENLLNGRVVSGKYVSSNIRWNKAHVVVFANWLPRLDAHGLSEDRWKNGGLRQFATKNETLELRHLDWQSAKDMWTYQIEEARAAVFARNTTRAPIEPATSMAQELYPLFRKRGGVVTRADSNESD